MAIYNNNEAILWPLLQNNASVLVAVLSKKCIFHYNHHQSD